MYLGKRIEVKVPSRGNNGKPDGKFTTITGICLKEPGENTLLGEPLYTVVDRTPVALNTLEDIKIIEDGK